MDLDQFSTARVAGLLLVLSVAVILGAAGLIASQGRLSGMAAAFQGVGPGSQDASGLRTIGRAAVPYLMAQLAGFALLALLLHRAGDGGMAVVALIFFVFSSVLATIEGSFHASVTVWAAEEAMRTGSAPEFFDPLRRWLQSEVQGPYMSFLLVSLLLFSVSALRTGVIGVGVAWVALGWSLLSFPLYFLLTGAPLVTLPLPLIFGIGLLLRG